MAELQDMLHQPLPGEESVLSATSELKGQLRALINTMEQALREKEEDQRAAELQWQARAQEWNVLLRAAQAQQQAPQQPARGARLGWLFGRGGRFLLALVALWLGYRAVRRWMPGSRRLALL